MTTPTQGEHAQTEALDAAQTLEYWAKDLKGLLGSELLFAAAKLRSLHAQVAALTAERPVAPATIPRAYSGRERGAYEAGWDDGFDHGKRTAAPAQPAAPQGVAYAELPASYQSSTLIAGNDGCTVTFHFGTGCEADVESWLSAVTERASHGQAPAGAALEELLILLGSKKAWPSYYFNHKDRYECCDCGEEHDDYAEITHAETCDFTQATADRKRIKELVEILKSSAPTAQAAPAAGAVGWVHPDWRAEQGQGRIYGHNPGGYVALAPTAPAAQADSVLEDADQIRALIGQHAAILAQNESAYFELCYHRATGWMAWITDKPLCMPPVVNPDRKVLAHGQGDTAYEACRDAARKQGGL